jgi:hypothetical protein
MSNSPDSVESTIFDITSITIVSPAIGSVDIQNLKYIVEDFNIYQSIFSSVMSGDIVVKDSNNILTQLALNGSEFLYINFTKGEQYATFEKSFRIVKITEVGLKNLNTLKYKIHFVSEELVLDQQFRISKSYKGFYDSQIVADILINYLQVPAEKITLEQTVIPHDEFIVPNLKPFEAIQMLTSFTLNPTLTSAFLFFETQSGFKFQSLESLITAEPYKSLSLRPQNILSETENKLQHVDYISDFEIPQLFNVLDTASNGGYASSMLKLNLINQEAVAAFSDPVASTPFTTLNDYLPFTNSKNRLNGTVIDSSAYVRYFVDLKGGLVDKMLLQRAHQLALLNNHRMNIMIAGDTQYEAGQVIYVDFPYIQPINETSETIEDPYKNGNYIITGVRHRILENKYLCYLELCKDSVTAPFPGAVADDSQLLKSIKSS